MQSSYIFGSGSESRAFHWSLRTRISHSSADLTKQSGHSSSGYYCLAILYRRGISQATTWLTYAFCGADKAERFIKQRNPQSGICNKLFTLNVKLLCWISQFYVRDYIEQSEFKSISKELQAQFDCCYICLRKVEILLYYVEILLCCIEILLCCVE